MRIRNVVLFVSLSCVLGAQVAHAQALLAPIENLVINRAEAAIISRVAIARGFAANDPRIAATLTGMSTVSTGLNVASTALGVGMTIAGAPVWMTIAAGLGVVALGLGVSAMINGNQAQISVASTSAGNKLKVDVPGDPMPAYTPVIPSDTTPLWAQAVQQGAPIYRNPSNCFSGDSCFALPLVPNVPSYRYSADSQGKTVLVTNDIIKFGQWYTFLTKPAMTLPDGVSFSWSFAGAQIQQNSTGGNSITVNIFESRSGGDAQGLPSYSRMDTFNNVGSVNGNIGPQYYSDLNTAFPSMPSSLTGAKLSADTLARLANQSWQQAANAPGYHGLPYSVTLPLTAMDVQPWIDANPTAAPTIGDLLTPASDPGISTVTISPTAQPGASAPNAGSSPSVGDGTNVNVVNTPNVNVVNKVSVDLGSDPGVQSPTLESMPTISMILSPLLNLLPDLKHWTVPTHNAVCPEPSFSMLGHSFTLKAQCDLAESNRTAIYTAFAAMFTLAALFIVLRA
jgi:hypothetical protein